MPKQISPDALEGIVSFVGKHPEGIKLDKIVRGLKPGVSNRTLQRRLKELIQTQGRLRSTGSGKATLYYPKKATKAPKIKKVARSRSTEELKLSDEGYEVLQLVTRSKGKRDPVSYDSNLLETYEPNVSFYLSEALRAEMAEAGNMGKDDLPAGTYLRQVMNRLIIDLSWNSSRLEGNTYSLLDTQLLIERGESADGKAVEEAQMILNHKAAIEMLAEEAGVIGFNRYTICNLHALLAENLLPNPDAGGMLRTRLIGIAHSVYEPLQVPQQIETYFDLMLKKAESIRDPFEQSFFMMVHLPYLQPFEDVNKRVSRLAANIPMIRNNLCPLSFVDVNKDDYVRATLGVYELCRIEYLRDVFVSAYKRSCARYSAIRQALGAPDPFRLRYRMQIGDFMRAVVIGIMNKRAATRWIADQAKKAIDENDQAKFQEVVETELGGLHEGNIARYRLRPSEFNKWKVNWK